MLRRKQSLIRYSIVSTVPLRARYCGKRANTPTHDPVGRRPSSRWQLTQRNRLPTWAARLSRVASIKARPRRMAAPSGPDGIRESAGPRETDPPGGAGRSPAQATTVAMPSSSQQRAHGVTGQIIQAFRVVATRGNLLAGPIIHTCGTIA